TDRLRLPVLEHGEVFLLEIRDGLPVLVVDDHVDLDQPCAAPEDGRRCLLRRRLGPDGGEDGKSDARAHASSIRRRFATRTTSNCQLPTPKQHDFGGWKLVSWELSRCKDQLPTSNSQLPSSTTWRLEVGVLGVVPRQGPAPNSQAAQLGGWKLVSWELS